MHTHSVSPEARISPFDVMVNQMFVTPVPEKMSLFNRKISDVLLEMPQRDPTQLLTDIAGEAPGEVRIRASAQDLERSVLHSDEVRRRRG